MTQSVSLRYTFSFVLLLLLTGSYPLMAQTGSQQSSGTQRTTTGTQQGTQIPSNLTPEQMRQLQMMQQQQQGAINQYDPERFTGTFNALRLTQELQQRDVTREELRSRLARRGILLENIQEENLPRYRDVIMQTIMEIEMEKSQVKDDRQLALEELFRELEPKFVIPPSVRTVTVEDFKLRLLDKGIVYDNVRPDQFGRYETIFRETLIELQEELEKERQEERMRRIYGHSIFTDNTLEAYRLSEGASATRNYILGTGDLVRITIFGASTADLALEINERGFVQPQGLPQIYLRGLTVAQARDVLRQRLANHYDFRSDQIAITVQETRPITVSVLGESRRVGTYYLSAMNSVFNVLALSGGPTEIGSVRRIEHIRGDQRTFVDVYALLRDPSSQFKFDLQHSDVINIPVARTIVRVEGAVRRPMRYELLDSESLYDLIEFAGGLAENAYPTFVQIQRFDQGEVNLLEFDLVSVMNGSKVVNLRNGDLVRIRSQENLIFNKVSVAGMVHYPGDFGFREGMTAGEAISLAGGLRPSAFERAYIERRSLRDTTMARYLPINLGTRDGVDFPLERNDKIMVYDRTTFSNVGDLSITGAVNETRRFTYDPDLTLYDLFTAAGGFAVGAAYNRVEVFRTNVFTDRPITMELITLELDEHYNVIKPSTGFRLQPYDQVVVRLTPGFQLSRTVEINGEVEYPGVYPLESRQTHLSDIIAEAGGLRGQADPIGSTLFRTQGNRGYIITNLSEVMNNKRDEAYDPILFEGDVITITRRENIVSIRPMGTRMFTAVEQSMARSGINLTYQGNRSAKWYIQNYAGGFDRNADKNSVTVTLKNGQVLSTRRILWMRRYPKVQSGSTIQVAMKPERDPQQRSFDFDQFFNRTAQTTTTLLTILLLIRQL